VTFYIEGTRPSGQVVKTKRESIFIGPSH
jgi:hypothetical protein